MKNTIFGMLCCGLMLVGCGGGDGSDNGGGAGASGTGNTSGSAGTSAAGKGGASSSAGASSAGAPSAGASNTAGSSSTGDCALPAALVSCYAETGGGVAVCTETALAGAAVDVVKLQCSAPKENEHCPTNGTLVGYCKGGLTTYYYAPQSNNVWAAIEAGCEANAGTWCGL